MQYVPFGKLGFDVSRLGFGSMRMSTRQEEGKTRVDVEKAIALIRRAVDGGINYVDTAYGYHNEESEIVVGQALKDGYRERVTLTTKLPHWVVKEKADLDRVLDRQLEKLGQPSVDFYILHALGKDSFEKMKALDYRGFLKRALKDGRIKHTGFSFHDEADVFLNILDDFDFDMAQVQFNYLDENKQATLSGVIEAGRRGVPIVVMEPLRGGALANPPQNVRELIDANARGLSPVEWAFRYVADRAEVVTILSGMSSMEQLEDNLRIFSNPDFCAGTLSREDRAFTAELREKYLSRVPIGCTHCDYCQPCPKGVKIPDLFAAYNESAMLGNNRHFLADYKQRIAAQGDASACVGCQKCENICPQHLSVVSLLKTLRESYEKA